MRHIGSPLIFSLISFVAGVAFLQTRPTLPDAPGTMAIIPGMVWIILLLISKYIPRISLYTVLLGGIAAFFCGFGYAAKHAHTRIADELPSAWERKDITIIGVVDDLPAVNTAATRFSLHVEKVLTPNAVVPSRITLSWYRQSFDRKKTILIPNIAAGERWQLTVRLRRPHGQSNPGGFDSEAWSLQNNWRAVGYVREDGSYRRVDEFAARPYDYVQRLRETIRQKIDKTLGDKPYKGIVTALTLGEQRAIPSEQWQIFNRTGTTHLVVISGLHVSIFSMLIGGLFYGILKRIPALTRRCPALLLASLFGFVASAFYVALSGCGIPAQRTLIMLTVVLVALWTGRLNRPFRAWVWALFFVTLHDPWSPLANGFWLSFGAVGWLLFALSGRATPRLTDETPRTQKIMHTIFAGAYTQWIVTLGLMPLLLAIFQQFSLISFPANLIAIPVTTFVVVPLTLLSMIPGLSILWEMAYEVIDLLMRLLTALSQLPIAVWQQHDAPAWTIVAGLLGVMWLLSPRGVPMRGMGLLWCVPLFVVTPPAPSPPGFQATVLDVGQGLAVFVRTQNHRLLYDTGPHYSELSDAGDRVVIPFLRHLAVNKLDTLIISHNDSDHAGGAKSVLQHYPVDQLIVSEDHPYLNHTDYCREGLQWTWDGVSFAVLSPREETLRQNKNDNSCVLKIESPLGSLLLTGDIGADVENQLIQYYRDELDSSIIVAPHHGSRHSSSASFVKEVNPWHTVFSSGYLNRYQHPRQEIVARYQNVISDVWRTDQSGAITFNVNEKGIEVLPYRQVNRRYWY